ncbi:hypothetical protein EMMF5_003980 [Cystobasidiomycetes sp. EMM_F5]
MAQPHDSNSLVDFIPLIRSPATWTPRPVELPPDIHPLPDDIKAYFVYPYSLEDHVLSPAPPHVSHSERITSLRDQHAKRLAFLKSREQEKARKRKEQLRKVAPGWEPPDDVGDDATGVTTGTSKRTSGILEPTRKVVKAEPAKPDVLEEAIIPTSQTRDVMDDLVEGLAKLEQDHT